MERPERVASFALVSLLLVALATPVAAAESPAAARQKREEVRVRQAEAAAKLSELNASDVELEAAVATLKVQVKGQTAKVASERQAVQAADRALVAANQRLAETEKKIAGLRVVVVNRAVASYVRPQSTAFSELSESKDVPEAGRRQSLLAQVASNDVEAIDRLRKALDDHAFARKTAEAAQKLAVERRKAVEDHLRGLQQNLSEQARLEAALNKRVAEVRAEVDALAAEESSITAIIAAGEARAAAELRAAAARAPRAAVAPPADAGRVSSGGLVWPTQGRVTSEYGSRWGRLHAGIDIAAPTGTRIVAAKAGVVIHAGWMGGYGNAVIVNHGDGLSTLYGHQSRIAIGNGASVGQGELLGYVGSTGNSTGPHLHFETRVGGSAQNPRRYL